MHVPEKKLCAKHYGEWPIGSQKSFVYQSSLAYPQQPKLFFIQAVEEAQRQNDEISRKKLEAEEEMAKAQRLKLKAEEDKKTLLQQKAEEQNKTEQYKILRINSEKESERRREEVK